MFKYLISCYILCVCFLEIFLAPKFGMEFFGGLILVHTFWGVLFEALGIFGGGVDFCPHSIVPVTWDPEYPPPPQPLGKDWLRLKLENAMREIIYHKKLWLVPLMKFD